MNLMQVVMTGVFTAIAYFLLVAFTTFEHQAMNSQIVSLGGVAVLLFLIMRKMFP